MKFLILIYSCFCLLQIVLSVAGLCDKITQSGSVEKVCCADYEEIDGMCTPCSPGTTSDTGENCRPCPDNTYGIRCAGECMCNSFQRCDKVSGCVLKSTTTSTTLSIRTNLPTRSEYTSSVYYTYNKSTVDPHTNATEVFSKFPPKTDTVTIKQSTKANTTDLSSRETIVYYTLAVIVLLLLTGLCFVFVKYRKVVNKRRLQLNTQDEESNQHNIQRAELEEMDDNLYDIIDDDTLDNHTINGDKTGDNVKNGNLNHDYLEVISGSTTSESNGSKKGERDSYLYPYQPLSANDSIRHEYEKSPRVVFSFKKDIKAEGYINSTQADVHNNEMKNKTYYNIPSHDTDLKWNAVLHAENKTPTNELNNDALLSGSYEFPLPTKDTELNNDIIQTKMRSYSW